MDHRQLMSFLTLAEELHFVRAAERLHITQSAVSQQIAKLEKQLNVRLFDRTKRKVTLSVAGQIFLEEARKGIRQLETAAAMAGRAAKGQTGRISIAYVDAAPFNILSPLVLAFRQAFPEVHLDLHEMISSEQFAAVLAGRIDVGLTRPMMTDPAIRSLLLQREPYVVVMPVGHPLANSDSIDMADLRHEPFIGTSAEKARYIEERFRDLTRRLGFTRRIVQEVNQIHAIIGLVGGGLGVTLVPQSVSKLKISGVVFKPLKNRNAPEAEMTAIWRANDDSPVVQRFLQIARKVCRTGPDGLASKRARR